jgi:hypothetical protein
MLRWLLGSHAIALDLDKFMLTPLRLLELGATELQHKYMELRPSRGARQLCSLNCAIQTHMTTEAYSAVSGRSKLVQLCKLICRLP